MQILFHDLQVPMALWIPFALHARLIALGRSAALPNALPLPHSARTVGLDPADTDKSVKKTAGDILRIAQPPEFPIAN